MSKEIFYHTASELLELLEKKEISSTQIAQSVIDRTKSVDDRVQAFVSYDADDLLNQAKAADQRRSNGTSTGILDGIPVGIKDILAVKDQPLTCSSKMLENFVSPYNASSIENLLSVGGLTWGRLNMDEFAMGSSSETSAFKKTANPWNLDCIPGGSSGGSAASVASGSSILALGTDTGGSIRQPASLCGIVGMKPTYGLVSRFGLVAFASSLDQAGPMTRSVRDAALLTQAIAGHDPKDSSSVKQEVPDYLSTLDSSIKGKKIGIPKEYFVDELSGEIAQKMEDAISFYKSQGCEIVDVSLPHTELAVPVYYIIATAEASSNLARYDGVRYTHRSAEASDAIDLYSKTRGEAFGSEVKRRIILGTYVLSSGYYDAYYLRAQKVRSLIRQDFENAFKEVDVLLTPTSPTTAFKKGEKADDPISMYLSDIFTISTNLAGLPAMSVPCGLASDGLPVGMQLIAPSFKEDTLFQFGHQFEINHDFANLHPEL